MCLDDGCDYALCDSWTERDTCPLRRPAGTPFDAVAGYRADAGVARCTAAALQMGKRVTVELLFPSWGIGLIRDLDYADARSQGIAPVCLHHSGV